MIAGTGHLEVTVRTNGIVDQEERGEVRVMTESARWAKTGGNEVDTKLTIAAVHLLIQTLPHPHRVKMSKPTVKGKIQHFPRIKELYLYLSWS
jgi:hypothetical protein